MNIILNQCSVSTDMSKISISLTSDSPITGLKMWTSSTYKDPNSFIDLSAYLQGQFTLSTEILASELDEITSFSELYFIEVEVGNGGIVVGTYEPTQFYIAQASLLSTIDLSCLSCNDTFQNAILLDMYLEALNKALVYGRFMDAIDFLNRIRITYIPEACTDCIELDPLISSAGNIVSVGVIGSRD